MVKVYFDERPLQSRHAVRGIGYYTKNLFENLRRERRIELVDSTDTADVVHYPYFDLFFNTLKPVSGKKNVVTVFDVIPLIYPQHYPPGLKGRLNFIKQKKALKSMDAVITISETSKKDIVRFLDIPAEKIHVIYLAASDSFRVINNSTSLRRSVEKFNLPERFVLYVGDVNYNKNLLSLAQACLSINIPLVIVGKQSKVEEFDRRHVENRSFAEFLDKYGNNPKILRVGFVENEDLVRLYNLATVYCQPSLYEGFALPVLEAMQCGTPVVVTKTQALVEVARSAAFVCTSTEAKDIAWGLKEVLDNPSVRRRYIAAGQSRAKKFDWGKVASRSVGLYREILEK